MKQTNLGLRLSLAATLVGVAGASFGQTPPDGDYAATQKAREQARARAARIRDIEQDRAGFVGTLLDPWRHGFLDGGEEMERFLLTAPVERLLAAASAGDLDAFRSAATGRRMPPNVLGDIDSDLVFFPVPPCRIFDTRSSGGGLLVAGVTRSFLVNGDMTAQGGDAGGCGIPADPSAVVFNLAAVTPTGAGNIRAWRFGDPFPLAAALNFNTGNTSPALSNMITVPTCNLCGSDISLRAEVSNVHAVGDVVGYYDVPEGLPLSAQATTGGVRVTVEATDTEVLGLDFICPADGFVIAMGHVVAELSHTNGTTDNMYLKLNNAADTNFFGPGWTQEVLPSGAPTGAYRTPVYLGARFACTAGVSTRYRINARMEGGASAGDQAGWGSLILQYSPN